MDFISVLLCCYATMFTVAIGARLIVFPMMIKQRRTLTRLTNHGPTLNKIQEKVQTAKALGDIVESKCYNSLLLVLFKMTLSILQMVCIVLVHILY